MYSINEAVQNLKPGDVLRIPPGTYQENIRMENISGTQDAPIHIVADGAVTIDGGGNEIAFAIINCQHIIIEGLEVTHAHYGIDVKSTPAQGATPLEGIVIKNNNVHHIDGPEGGHAIAVYGENPHAPITDLLIEGNQVHNNKLYWSEALVVNGNIDGFVIAKNIVWNNDNIGIDIIGFEGKAGDDPAVDCARNGKVYENIVYGCNTTGNEAYWSANHNVEGEVWTGRGEGPFEGKYDRCCGGIYVDGGWHIEIYHNFVFDNDLGIEIATEHKPPLVTKDVHVHDNIVASCSGWAGLIFGGYASNLGFTEECTFKNNILFGNDTSIAVQKSRNNILENNVIVGGWEAMDFNGDMAANNTFNTNYWENTNEDEDYFTQLETLPTTQIDAQIKTTALLKDPENGNFALDAPSGAGTSWRPAEQYLQLYAKYLIAQDRVNDAVEFLQNKPITTDITNADPSQCIAKYLQENSFADVTVKAILKTNEIKGLYLVQLGVTYGQDAYAQGTTQEGVVIIKHNN